MRPTGALGLARSVGPIMQAPARTLRPAQRIHRRRDFLEIYARASRRRGRYMTVFVLANDRDVTRLGVAAPRRLGNAVVRNRTKRRARAIFRQSPLESGLDIVVAPTREFAAAPFATLEAEFLRMMNGRARGR